MTDSPFLTSNRRLPRSLAWARDGLILLILALYILAGTMLVPVHGDEFMQISMAHDFFYLQRGEWSKVAYTPPVYWNSEQYLRLINGTINKTLIGLSWKVSGRNDSTLPGIYNWETALDWNEQHGNTVAGDALLAARLPSALLTALGLIPLFVLARIVVSERRWRFAPYAAVLIYALDPAVLINGRRAMMEGSLMLTTLMAMCWAAAMVSDSRSAGFMQRIPVALRYVILGALCGLMVAAKDTGVAAAAAAMFGVLIITAIMRWRQAKSWRASLPALAWIIVAGVVSLVVWFALTPAFWNDPINATRTMLDFRSQLLIIQSKDDPLRYNTIFDSLRGIITEPFLTAPQYFELSSWLPWLKDSISAYEQTVWAGWIVIYPVVGAILTLAALVGAADILRRVRRGDPVAGIIVVWAVSALVTALPVLIAWQRYYLPLLLVAIIFATDGLATLVRLAMRSRVQTPIAPDAHEAAQTN